MPSITTWLRLEPRSRDAEMNTSLQARVYDPLWLLARQWQFGEFEGQDNGSPVSARWRGEAAPLTQRLAPPESAALRRALEGLFAPALREPVLVDAVALYVEPSPGAPFSLKRRYPLGPAA